jgi:hypothetical protein
MSMCLRAGQILRSDSRTNVGRTNVGQTKVAASSDYCGSRLMGSFWDKDKLITLISDKNKQISYNIHT